MRNIFSSYFFHILQILISKNSIFFTTIFNQYIFKDNITKINKIFIKAKIFI